MVRVGSL